jgi:Tol biopolymer transport system component
MTTWKLSHIGKASARLVLVQAWFALTAAASTLQLVSAIDPQLGPATGGGGDSYLPVISRDGRYVLFASTANNLVSVGTNRPLPSLTPAPINVFLRDRTKNSTVLVSVNLYATGGGDGDSLPIEISTNGRYALFESSASNLVAGDTNNAADVFVRDLLAGTTLLVSVSTNGGFGDDVSYNPVMTPDGRYVAFASAADNLVPGDTNGIPDVFVRDLASNVTSLVSVDAQSGQGFYFWIGSDVPVITPDGRYIAFCSTAANLLPGLNNQSDVYLRDQVGGTTTRANADALSLLQSLGSATNAISFSQVLSDDGRFLVFEAIPYPQAVGKPSLVLRYDVQTGHSDLIETNAWVSLNTSFQDIQNLALTPDGRFVAYVANVGDSSGTTTSIRVWDSQTGTNVLASGNQTNSVIDGSHSDSPVLDDAGRFVAFVSSAPDLVTNEIPGDFHLYLRDLQTATTTLIDADTNGVGSPIDPTSAAAMSADGLFVAFDSQDGNIVPADRNHAYDVFVRELTNPATELISAHDPGLASHTPDGASAISAFSLSSDARFIAFWSEADDLVGNDTNGLRDVFLRDNLAGTTLLVSINTNGVAGDGFSTDPAISADGQYVAFSSLADDLVSGNSNYAQNVFVAAVQQTGLPQLVSMNAAGTGPGNADSYSPILSSNGQSVLFLSKAGDLTPGMIAGTENLFWRDLQNHSTHALTTNGVTGASMTPDGRLVAFITSSAKTYLPTLSDRLYVWDSQSNSIIYSAKGTQFAFIALSPDGQKLAYATNSGNQYQLSVADRTTGSNWIIATYLSSSRSAPRFSGDGKIVYVAGLGSPVSINQIYLYDFQTQLNQLISRSYNGVSPGNDDSDSPDISSDGRFIGFRSAADNLVPGDTNGVPDIFLFDRAGGALTLISASRFGNASADNRSLMPVFSADGRTLGFESWASDLLPGDFNNNLDVFALGIDVGAAATSFAATVLPFPDPFSGNWLTWPVVLGKTYRVQFKDDLGSPAWQELNGIISIMGDRACLKDNAMPGTSRFYRVLAY